MRFQCLLFIRPNEELEAVKVSNSSPKGYAFLPRKFIHHPAHDLLSRNDIKVVTENKVTPASNASFEVIEIFFDSAPSFFGIRICVDSINLESFQRLISVDRNGFFFSTNFRRTESIRSAMDEENLKGMENFATANVKYCHPYGGTLLHFAVERGYVPLVKLLLKRGAVVNAEGPNGHTPLHIVSDKLKYPLNVEIAKLLIKEGADLEVKVKDKNSTDLDFIGFPSTPLHLAVCRNSFEIVDLLAERGADLEVRTNRGYSSMHIAAFFGFNRGIDCLIQRGALVNSVVDSDAHVMKGATPLILAVMQKRHTAVTQLLENGANVNAKCSNGQSVLYFAVKNAVLEIVECVLNFGPDVDDAANKRAFQLAFLKNARSSKVIAEKMVEYGFAVGPEDINVSDYLYGAIQKNLFPVVETLVDFGANVNQCRSFNGHKLTPLHLAAQCASEEIVQLLLDLGAEVDAKRGNGRYSERTPLFEAVAFSNLIAAKLLLAKNARVEGHILLHTAVRNDSLPMVLFLLENGIDVNITTPEEPRLPIHNALAGSSACVIEQLMKFGARFDFNFVSVSDQKGPNNLKTFLDYGFLALNLAAVTRINYLLTSNNELPLRSLEVLVHHVIKVETAFESFVAKDVVPDDLYTLFDLDSLKRLCEAEVALMKVERLGWTSVTFFDVLVLGVEGIARCFERNKSIERSLEAYEKYAKERYPIYASVITCHLRQGSLRKKLMASGLKIFSSLPHLSGLPDELKAIVVNYLSNQDLLILQKSINVA